MINDNPRVVALAKELDLRRELLQAAQAAVQETYDQHQELVSSLTEAADFDKIEPAELVANAWGNRATHQKLQAYVKSLGLYGTNYYGDGSHSYAVIGPSFLPEKSADMRAIESGIRAFHEKFGELSEIDGVCRIGFTENTLSEHGVYSTTWTPATDSATLDKVTYGRHETLFTGSLAQVLDYVQEHHWYGEPRSSDDDDDYY